MNQKSDAPDWSSYKLGWEDGVMAERQRIVNLLMIQHEAAKGAHNYWHVAAQLIQADVASDTQPKPMTRPCKVGGTCEQIRIRIMSEAYDLADRGDHEGYNAVKVMCSDVLQLIKREWVGLTEQDIKDCKKQSMVNGSLPFEQRSFFARAIEAKLKERNT